MPKRHGHRIGELNSRFPDSGGIRGESLRRYRPGPCDDPVMKLSAKVIWATVALGCVVMLVAADRAAAQSDASISALREDVRLLAESIQGARQDLAVVQRTQARTLASVDELQTVVQTVDAKLEEFNHRLRELTVRLDALQVRMMQSQALRSMPPPEPQIVAGPTPEPKAPPAPSQAEVAETGPTQAESAQAEETEAEPTQVAEAPKEEPAEAAPPPAAGPITPESVQVAILDPQEIFRAAQEDYAKGNYELAIFGFKDYLRKYPVTEQASAAQFWLGESYLGQENYDQAAAEFQRLLDRYPTSPKIPTALYKQALAYVELKQYEKARANLEAVMGQFPTSAEAKQAAEEIKNLSGP